MGLTHSHKVIHIKIHRVAVKLPMSETSLYITGSLWVDMCTCVWNMVASLSQLGRASKTFGKHLSEKRQKMKERPKNRATKYAAHGTNSTKEFVEWVIKPQCAKMWHLCRWNWVHLWIGNPGKQFCDKKKKKASQFRTDKQKHEMCYKLPYGSTVCTKTEIVLFTPKSTEICSVVYKNILTANGQTEIKTSQATIMNFLTAFTSEAVTQAQVLP